MRARLGGAAESEARQGIGLGGTDVRSRSAPVILRERYPDDGAASPHPDNA